MIDRWQTDFTTFSASYCRLPPFRDAAERSASDPYVIEMAFSPNPACLVRKPCGAAGRREVPRNSGGMTSGESIVWIEVPEPTECVEFRLSDALRKTVAEELRAPHAAELAEIGGITNPILWSASARYRAHALGGWQMSDVEASEMVRGLLAHMMLTFLGAKPQRATRARLDARRLSRVDEYIKAHLADALTVEELADVAAMSPFHFIRVFRRTLHMTPGQYVLARRMEHARDLLRTGNTKTLGDVASRVGYTNGHYFRRAFSRFFGHSPGVVAAG